MKTSLWLLSLILINLFTKSVHAESHTSKPIGLATIDGRDWLVDSRGDPFFAHGITHASNNRNAFDYTEFSAACKRLGFNAYGYGCPPQLRGDMPYVESWNHLVPITT